MIKFGFGDDKISCGVVVSVGMEGEIGGVGGSGEWEWFGSVRMGIGIGYGDWVVERCLGRCMNNGRCLCLWF